MFTSPQISARMMMTTLSTLCGPEALRRSPRGHSPISDATKGVGATAELLDCIVTNSSAVAEQIQVATIVDDRIISEMELGYVTRHQHRLNLGE